MFDSIYVGLTGLDTFSRNLTVIGNNVTNVNTPGFKASNLLFTDLDYQNEVGAGVGDAGTRVLFSQGQLRQTGNPTDVAISGAGFFILRDGAKTTYTRAGDFQFGADGVLTSRENGARVAGLSGGALQDVSIADLHAIPGRATSVVHFSGNLTSGGTSADVNVTVFDASGGSHALKITFTNNSTVTPRSWLFQTTDETGNVIDSGEVRFNGDGSPATGFDSHSFTFSPTGADATQIKLDFGQAGGFAGLTNFSSGTDSTAQAKSQDGFAAGGLTSATFNSDGALALTYSNGQTRVGMQLALAFFEDTDKLTQAASGAFQNDVGLRPTIGAANSRMFGSITAGSLESANVDLSQSFSDLIITQRGYQASSQVISTANDMIQQLFDIRGKQA